MLFAEFTCFSFFCKLKQLLYKMFLKYYKTWYNQIPSEINAAICAWKYLIVHGSQNNLQLENFNLGNKNSSSKITDYYKFINRCVCDKIIWILT